ncbi:MAG: hypothetical protein EXQ96_01210 [Alphaproteobacteria bacterium]|nr:hypothetical protein [Alphaproteobacteria bacterium]
MNKDLDARLVRIETGLANNERSIGELSDILRDSVKRLDLLTKEISALSHEHAQLCDTVGGLVTEGTR